MCDTDAAEEGNNYASAVPNNNDGNTNKSGDGGGSQLRVTIQEDSVIGRADPSDGGATETTKTMSATSNNNNSCTPQPELCQPLGASHPPAPPGILATSSKISSPGDTAAVIKPTTMPHQRHGHTCFVWDPRELALTKSSDNVAAGRNTVSRGAGGAPASPKRGQSKVGLSCVCCPLQNLRALSSPFQTPKSIDLLFFTDAVFKKWWLYVDHPRHHQALYLVSPLRGALLTPKKNVTQTQAVCCISFTL